MHRPMGAAAPTRTCVATQNADRRAENEGLASVQDPDVVPVPVSDLLSKEYAAERHKLAARDHVRLQAADCCARS